MEWILPRFSDQCCGSRWHRSVHCRNAAAWGVESTSIKGRTWG